MDYQNKIERKVAEGGEKGNGGLIGVIIGIDGYNDKKFKPLQCAVNDAVYLLETLQKVWKNRKLLIKPLIWPSLQVQKAKTQRETWGIELPADAGGVTRDAILTAVREFANRTEESDTFLFYFSGHGVLVGQEPALVTVAEGKTARGIEYLKIAEIQQAAVGCASLKKVIILDCCQSATGKNKTGAGYENLESLTRGWSILISSSPGEVSLEDKYTAKSSDDYLQQGIFTASLVEGLRGEAIGSSGMVSLADLYFYGWVVVIAVTGSNLYKNGVEMSLLGAHQFWIVLVCDIIAMIFVTWLVFWYYAAYKFFQKEVYKR